MGFNTWNSHPAISTGQNDRLAVSAGVDGVVKVSVGQNFIYALKADATVWSWGQNVYNADGQVSNSNGATKNPKQVVSGANDVATGQDHGLVLLSNGTVLSAGEGSQYGNLGRFGGRDGFRSVDGITTGAAISAQGQTSFVLTSSGTVLGFGDNRSGQLGTEVPDDRSHQQPTAIAGLTNVKAIAKDTFLALKTDGTVWTWAQQTNTDQANPTFSGVVQITGLPAMTSLPGGRFATASDGTLWDTQTKQAFSQFKNVIAAGTARSGWETNYVIDANGTAWSNGWSKDGYSQRGDGGAQGQTTAFSRVLGVSPAIALGTGQSGTGSSTAVFVGRSPSPISAFRNPVAAGGGAQGGPVYFGETSGGCNPSQLSGYAQRCHADPVNTATGAFTLPSTDISVPGRGAGLSLSRTYDSAQAVADGPFGRGWAASFTTRLAVDPYSDNGTALSAAAAVNVVQENGSRVAFVRNSDGSYSPPSRAFATLKNNADGTWTYVRQQRNTFTFNAEGQLVAMSDLNGSATALAYDGAGQLSTITDAAGRTITLTWTNGRITKAVGPLNRTVTYAYDSDAHLTTVTMPDGGNTSYGYDAVTHRMTAWSTPRGSATLNAYDSAGRVTSQTDPTGGVTTFAYDGSGPTGTWTVTVTDPRGTKSVQTYTDSLLTKEVLASGTSAAATTSYTYDPASLGITKVTDPLGRVTTTTRDAAGRPLTITDPLNRVATFTYNARGDVLTATDTAGVVTTNTYDARGNLLTTTTPTTVGGSSGSQRPAVNVARSAMATASSQNNDYNQTPARAIDGRVGGYPADSGAEWITNGGGAGSWLQLTWPTATTVDRVVLFDRVNNDDQVTAGTLTFADGSTVTVPALNNDGSATTVTFTAKTTTSIRFTATAVASGTANVGLAEMQAWTPRGSTPAYGENLSVLATATASAASDNYGQTPGKAIDGVMDGYPGDYHAEWGTPSGGAGSWLQLNWPTSVTVGSVVLYDRVGIGDHITGGTLTFSDGSTVAVPQLNDDGAATVVTFTARATTTLRLTITSVGADNSNAGLAEIIARGPPPSTSAESTMLVTSRNTYDDENHPGQLLYSADPNGATSSYTYDAAGNLLTVADPLGNTTSATYDAAGQKLTSTTARGNIPARWSGPPASQVAQYTTTTAYDAAGRVTSTTDPLGRVTSFGYDADGNPTTVTDAKNQTATTTYDAAGRPTQVTRPDGTMTKTAYDAAGLVTSTTNGAGKTTSYTYDALARPLSVTDPLGRVTTSAYDLAGQRTSTTDALGKTTTLTYDSAGQLTKTAYNSATTADVTYSYDGAGRLKTMVDGTGTTTRAYDALDRLTAVTNGAGAKVSYCYDAAGQQTTLTYPGSTGTVTRTYDPAGRMTSLVDPLNKTFSFGYDVEGHLTGIGYPNKVNTAYSWDRASQLTGNTVISNAGTSPVTLGTFTNTLDATGLVSATTTSGTPQVNRTYTYDKLGQLTASATTGTTPVTTAMTYDAADNLTKTDAGAALTYDAGNQLTKSTPTSGTATTFSFDANGQRTAATTGSTTAGYTWDQAGQLTKVTPASGSASTYTYDGAGLRIKQVVGSTTTAFTWDTSGGLPMLLSDGLTYVYGPGGIPLEQISGTTPTYLSGDTLGSVRLLTNASATVTAAIGYSPYGNPTRTGSATSKHGFAGEYTDTTGLIYLRARYYDPTTNQFLSRDPLVSVSAQPYSYAHNSPLNLTDPTGLIGWGQKLRNALLSPGGRGAMGFIAGLSDSTSMGLSTYIGNLISPEYNCYFTSSGWYKGGVATGLAAGLAAPIGGAAKAAFTAVRAGKFGKAAQTGDHIVLGLRDQGLRETAEKVGGRTLLSDADWRGTLLKASADPKARFTVSLDGLSGNGTYSQVMNAASRGAGPAGSNTDWEMAMLYQAGRLGDVNFVRGGATVANPFK